LGAKFIQRTTRRLSLTQDGGAFYGRARQILRDVDSAAAEVAKLKQQPGKDLVILGSAKLASSLLPAGLIDEYRVIISPILLGKGNPLFGGIKEKIDLKLGKTKLLSSGVSIIYYQKV